MKITFDATETPVEDDVSFVQTQLRAYNRTHVAIQPQEKMAVFARDEAGQIVGGATGGVNWGWLYVELLWVGAAHRGLGVGSELLSRVEEMSRAYNVVGFHLGTTDFQALDFYLKAGYAVWGQLANFPPGHTNYSLSKLNKDYDQHH